MTSSKFGNWTTEGDLRYKVINLKRRAPPPPPSNDAPTRKTMQTQVFATREGNGILTLGKWQLGPLCIDRREFRNEGKDWVTREELTMGMELKTGPKEAMTPMSNCLMTLPLEEGKTFKEKLPDFDFKQRCVLFCIAMTLFINAGINLYLAKPKQESKKLSLPNFLRGNVFEAVELDAVPELASGDRSEADPVGSIWLLLVLIWSLGIFLRHLMFKKSIERLHI